MILARNEGEGLGFNIIGGEEEVGIFCSVISPDGLAGRNGQLKVGDQIMEVSSVMYLCYIHILPLVSGEWSEYGALDSRDCC